VGPSTGRFDVGGQRLTTPPIRGRAGELIDEMVQHAVNSKDVNFDDTIRASVMDGTYNGTN
jgi:hypothetical protein